MPNRFFLNKIDAWSRLMRLHAPVGYLLCFFPAAYGLLLGANGRSVYGYLLLFFLGSIIVRSAGCIVNDLWDRDFDPLVERTRTRPLASGEVSVKEALVLLFVMALLGLFILLTLPRSAIYVGIVAAVLISLYPLMKRVTYYPQVFLGLTFSMGVLIGYATMQQGLSVEAFILYVGCGVWNFAYDTIYAFMDIKDDKKIGIKSTAIIFENKSYKVIIGACYALFFASFLGVFWHMLHFMSFFIIFGAAAWSAYLIWSLDVGHSGNCLYRFKANSWMGWILLLEILLENMMQAPYI